MSPKYFQTPFAGNGDKAEIKDLTQPDGTVSYEEGYGADYETNPAANGGKFMFVERSQMNGVLNDITGNLKQWQEQGYYTYNPDIKYGVGGRCNYNDGTGLKAYVSTTDNNTRVPSVNGVVQSGWIATDLPPSEQDNLLVGLAHGAGYQNMTPQLVRKVLGVENITVKFHYIPILDSSSTVTWPTEINLADHGIPADKKVILLGRVQMRNPSIDHASFGINSDFTGNFILPVVEISHVQNIITSSPYSFPTDNAKINIGCRQGNPDHIYMSVHAYIQFF